MHADEHDDLAQHPYSSPKTLWFTNKLNRADCLAEVAKRPLIMSIVHLADLHFFNGDHQLDLDQLSNASVYVAVCFAVAHPAGPPVI